MKLSLLWQLACVTHIEAYTKEAIADRILSLPYALNTDFKSAQFSGYLQISNEKFVHYMYYESENDPISGLIT